MKMKLKRVLAELRIQQNELAAALEKPDGQPLSEATIAQLVNHGQWPKSLGRVGLELKIKETLVARGAHSEHLRDLFRMEEEGADAAPVLAGDAASALSNANSKESETMLLGKIRLAAETRQHFRLESDPFDNEMHGSDAVYLSDDIRYVRQAIRQTAKHGGMLAVIGESGAGKSTLRQDLEEWIEANSEPIKLIEPFVLGSDDSPSKGKPIKSIDLIGAVIRCIGRGEMPKGSLEDRSNQMYELLKNQARSGKQHVLLIEEAHALSKSTLKHLKRFYELRAGFKQLLSIILIGQTELNDKLDEDDPDVREVVQRCEKVWLQPLDNNLEAYLAHKFQRAGANYLDIFDESAFSEIRYRLQTSKTVGKGATRTVKKLSLCYPLVVNNLVSGAMNQALKVGERKLSGELIAAALRGV